MRGSLNILTAIVFAGAMTSHAATENLTNSSDHAADRWEFKVLLDDREIGYHHFEVRQHEDLEKVDTEARFKVRVMFFTAYRYAHNNSETWQDNCLQTIESQTNDNGTNYAVSGTDSGEGFSLLRNQEAAKLEQECLQTFAYWNPEILDADKLLNSQTGKVQPVSIDFLGERDIEVNGSKIRSNEYVISTPDGDITVWYAQGSQQWLGLETRTEGDRLLRYQPVHVPERQGIHQATPNMSTAP